MRAFAVMVFCNAGALIFASQSFEGESVDFIKYHAAYVDVCVNGMPDTILGPFGIELGLPAVYDGLATVLPCDLSINALAYVQILLFSITFLLLAGAVISRAASKGERAEIMLGTCLLFPFFYTTQLSRQFPASCFLLFAIYLAAGWRSKLLAVLLATTFHISSLFVFVFTAVVRQIRIRHILILGVAGAAVVLLFAKRFVELASADRGVLIGRLVYYADANLPESVLSDFVTMLLCLGSGLMMAALPRTTKFSHDSARLLVVSGLTSVVLIGFPLLVTRTYLLFGGLFIGAYLFYALRAFSAPVSQVLAIGLLLYRLISMSGAGRNAADMLWRSYPAVSPSPGYFIGM